MCDVETLAELAGAKYFSRPITSAISNVASSSRGTTRDSSSILVFQS
eukprot:ctg_6639.g657